MNGRYRKVRVRNGKVIDLGLDIGPVDEIELFIYVDSPENELKRVRIGRRDAWQWGDYIESARYFNPSRSQERMQARLDCITWAIRNGYWNGTIEELL